MKKILMLAALLMPLLGYALPFVPTTGPDTKPIHWYYLKTGGRFVYASEGGENADIAASSSSQNNDAYYWCFVGNSSGGYRIYNRATKKYLYAGEFLSSNYNDPSIDKVETRDNNSFYITTFSNRKNAKIKKFKITHNILLFL